MIIEAISRIGLAFFSLLTTDVLRRVGQGNNDVSQTTDDDHSTLVTNSKDITTLSSYGCITSFKMDDNNSFRRSFLQSALTSIILLLLVIP